MSAQKSKSTEMIAELDAARAQRDLLKKAPNIEWIKANERVLDVERKLKAEQISKQPTAATLTDIDDHAWANLREALWWPTLRKDCGDNDKWSEVGYALLSLRKTRPVKELFCSWSREVPNYRSGDNPISPEDWWESHSSAIPRSDFRHIFNMAHKRGWRRVAKTSDFGLIDNPLDTESQSLPERPTIHIAEAKLHKYAAQAEELLATEIYTQGQNLVRIGQAYEERKADELNEGRTVGKDGIRRSPDQPFLVPVTSAVIERLLTRKANILKYVQREKTWRSINCPEKLAAHIVNQRTWSTIRPLDAITRAPFVRADGSICDVPGYDYPSRALYIPSADFPPLPHKVSESEAQAALNTLLEPFTQFPFKDDSARSAFVAHILTEAARLAADCVPMFFYTAPDRGTGKSLLCEMPPAIVHGTVPARRPWVSDGNEIRKSLSASLAAGDRSIMLDNVPSGLRVRAPELCAMLTAPVWEDRKLCESTMIRAINRAVISATGNNIVPSQDMPRRSLVIRLVANMPVTELEKRAFTITNLREYVAAHRVELLMAALRIFLGHRQSGHISPVSFPSFEGWSRMVRDPLIWLGMTDPIESQKGEVDDESISLVDAFKLLGSMFEGTTFAANDVAHRMQPNFSDTDGKNPATLIASGCREPQNPRIVGYWLGEYRDKVAGGYQLRRLPGSETHSARYRFHRESAEDLL